MTWAEGPLARQTMAGYPTSSLQRRIPISHGGEPGGEKRMEAGEVGFPLSHAEASVLGLKPWKGIDK